MSSTGPGDQLDRWLRDTLRERPLPSAPPALAERAQARAQAIGLGADGVLDRLASRWRWGLWINLLAGAVVVALFVGLVPGLLQPEVETSADVLVWQPDQSSPDASTPALLGLSTTDTFVLGAAAMLGAVLFLAIERALGSEDRGATELRLALALPEGS